MEANLTFKLPEEESEFKSAISGGHYKTVILNVKNELRRIVKYGAMTEEKKEIYKEVHDFINNELESKDLFTPEFY